MVRTVAMLDMSLENMTAEDGEWCLKRMEKSYYVHDNVKTYDETVQKSVSSKTFAVHNVEAMLNLIAVSIPHQNGSIILKPYKFNCCGEKCFFAAQRYLQC